MPFHDVCSIHDVQEGQGKPFTIGSLQIALFNLDAKFFAIENTCPHRGGSLGDGSVYEGAVICPDHSYQFDIRTGQPYGFPNGIKTFAVKVENDRVFVDDGEK